MARMLEEKEVVLVGGRPQLSRATALTRTSRHRTTAPHASPADNTHAGCSQTAAAATQQQQRSCAAAAVAAATHNSTRHARPPALSSSRPSPSPLPRIDLPSPARRVVAGAAGGADVTVNGPDARPVNMAKSCDF
jgi:hypothetical protein